MESATVAIPARQDQLTKQADTDAQVVALWLHGKSPHTQRAYTADVGRFEAFVAKPLAQVALGDVQAFAGDTEGVGPVDDHNAASVVVGLAGVV